MKNFCELITALYWQRINVVTFFGPEEKNLMGFFSEQQFFKTNFEHLGDSTATRLVNDRCEA